MLYLAEVTVQNRGFVGGYKTELKLLASQGSDQSWNTISGNSILTLDTVNEAASVGALYILNLDDNKQLQAAPELAGNRIVNYLRHFSRVLEKSKAQEVEIEEWKTSLQLQGEQIALRQNELDQQQQVISQKEQEFSQLNQEKEQLSGAWDELRKEQTRSQGQKENLTNLIAKLENNEISAGDIPDLVNFVNSQQKFIDNYWQQLESDKNSLPSRDEDLKTKQQQLEDQRQLLEQKQTKFINAQVLTQFNQNILAEKEKGLKFLNTQLEGIDRLEQELSVIDDDDDDNIDINALENMPLGDLESTVNNLQQETSKLVNFVNLQEEELSLQGDAVREIEDKMASASAMDLFDLESELADAQEAMKLLNETLVGQRKTLKKQQKTLNEHLKILTRRKGVTDVDFKETINVQPLMTELNNQRISTVKKINQLTEEIEEINASQASMTERVKSFATRIRRAKRRNFATGETTPTDLSTNHGNCL